MIQEERQLLFKDLCARLPYGVIIQRDNCFGGKITEKLNAHGLADNETYGTFESLNYKPYLRTMSSMTEEEKKELSKNLNYEFYVDDDFALVAEDDRHRIRLELCDVYIDWLNKHHFDYLGLIPMGLAIVAPEGMYNG